MERDFFSREEAAVVELMTIKGIGMEFARAFIERGIYSRDDLRRADDITILLIPGIGPARLASFREQLGAGP